MELETVFFTLDEQELVINLLMSDNSTTLDVVDMQQGDVSKLNALQRNLHEQLLDLPLCDTASFVDQLEATYRDIWRD